MRNYAVYLPNPAIVNISKFQDLIPTGFTIKLSGSYTTPQIVSQLKALNVLDSQASVSYTVQIADTLTSIYIWRNIQTILPGAGNPSNASFLGTPGGNTITPSIGSNISPDGNVGQGQLTPKNKQFPVGSTPWQQPQMLAVLLLQDRITSTPLLNATGPYFTTQKVITTGGNGDPGLVRQMIPVYYPNTVQQTENVKNGNFAANGNTIPGTAASNNIPTPLPGYKEPTEYGPLTGPQYANPNPPDDD